MDKPRIILPIGDRIIVPRRKIWMGIEDVPLMPRFPGAGKTSKGILTPNLGGLSSGDKVVSGGGSVAPTFVAEYETIWNNTDTPKTTANFNVLANDVFAIFAMSEEIGTVIDTPPGGTLSATWTLRQTISVTDYCYMRLWTTIIGSDQSSVNISITMSAGTGQWWGFNALHFRDSDGIGTTNQAYNSSGDPSLTLTSVLANSAIIMLNGDWNAGNGATRVYYTTDAGSFTEKTYFYYTTDYTGYGGYYADVGSAGNKTVGMTLPDGQQWSLVAVEVKGT